MLKVHVPLNEKEYDILIKKEILLSIESYIDIDKEYVIITDSNIPVEYIEYFTSKLKQSIVYTVNAGEKSKSIETAYNIINRMIDDNITRSITIIALGGGMIGDLAGFIASIFMRGVDFIQVPTTLLAQIDSSVGGKTAVNAIKMKNAIGAFKQPKLVLIDPLVLKTLDERQMSSGIAEMVKYGLIADKALFKDLCNKDIFFDIEKYIYKCVSIKANIVLEDEFDYGKRQLLNFGHTIGHAIEQESNYEVLHGEAVAIGMYIISKGNNYQNDLYNVLKKYNLPTEHSYDKNKLFEYILTDKKVHNNTLNIVLVEEIGNGFIKAIDLEEIKERM